jgi:outer membrane biogenesis lipoprotein LolB
MKALLTLLAALLLTGCTIFKSYVQNDAQAQMERDSAERQARLKAEGKLNDKELEVLSARMRWVRTDANGLPNALTVEEMERRAKAAEANKP